jgi:membrane protein required for colicin V production
MNVFDWILIALFVIGALWGYKTGLVDAVVNVAVIYIGLLLSGQFAGQVLGLFWDGVESEALATAIGYVIIFVGVFIAGRIVARIIKTGMNIVLLGWVDKAGGIVIGIVAGLLLAGGLTAVVARYTYVIEPEDERPAGLEGEALTDRLRGFAENAISDNLRGRADEQLVGSTVVPIILDVRNVLPGSALGMAPADFNLALDILDSKIELKED